jgi:hypothetical protein
MSERVYKDLVLQDFDRKLAANQLRPELVSPTRRSLKAHCVKICTERFDPKDELLLQSFFGEKENQGAYIKAIGNGTADKFRALHNFLTDRTIDTNFINIQLLAWMIDFEPRPYYPGMKLDEPEGGDMGGFGGGKPPTVEDDGEMDKKKKISKQKIVGFAILFGGILFAIYSVNKFKVDGLTGNERCMIWSNDHYRPVNCDEKDISETIYPIDRDLITNFKKITRPDTLTLYSVKKVWYINIRGRVEFYTASGLYPLDTTRRLLPMTDHILKKYVYHITD